MRVVTVFFIVCLAMVSVQSQTRKKASKTRKPVVRATVTIKGEPYEPRVYPSESDPNIWNEFTFRNEFIKISFPAIPGELEDSFESPEVDEPLLIASATTKNASYKLMARKLAVSTDEREIDVILENSIVQTYEGGGWRISKKKDVSYEGILGKELVAIRTVAEGEYKHYIRAYILNSHVITLFVSPNPASKLNLEPWSVKFFDSLKVKLPVRSEV